MDYLEITLDIQYPYHLMVQLLLREQLIMIVEKELCVCIKEI